VFTGFFNLRIQRDLLLQDLDVVAQTVAGIRDSTMPYDALATVGAVQTAPELSIALEELSGRNAEVRALLYRYTDEYPQVQQLRREIAELESVTIPGLVDALVTQLRSQLAQLESRIDMAATELEQIPPRSIEEGRLERNRAVAERLYTTLQANYEEARLAEASSVPDLRKLAQAVAPVRPVSNRGPKYIMMGFAAGLGLSLVGAVLLDRLDRRVRYLDQVTSDLGLSLLGVVPHLKGIGNGADGTAASPVVEALRGIRLNLVHAYGAAGPLIVTVTSPGRGDGKSFVASNLALAFADAGHRTLLIDGDVRRGALNRVLNVPRKPGLTDLLSGNVQQAEVLRETSFPSLFFIGCGTRTAEAPELLGSSVMTQLITRLRSSFSVIVVDSPPLGAGVDAFALGTVTGNLLMVLRLGLTDRELAGAKLSVLDRLPVRVLGAVLNDVREGGAYRNYRYYSYYLPGYEAEGEGQGDRALISSK
jgi:capsular exopolysaccharide synthesis family protein